MLPSNNSSTRQENSSSAKKAVSAAEERFWRFSYLFFLKDKGLGAFRGEKSLFHLRDLSQEDEAFRPHCEGQFGKQAMLL